MVEISLVVLFILFFVMFFLLMSLFLYLIVKKYVNNQMKQRIEKYKDAYRLQMFRYLQTGEQEGIYDALHDEEKLKALLDLLSDYSNVLDGEEVQQRMRVFAKQHLTHYLIKRLRHRRWSLRMNALYTINDFYMEDLSDTLHSMYHKKRTTVSEKELILQLFAKFNDDQLVRYIRDVELNVSNFSLLSILLVMSEEKLDELVKQFDELPKRLHYTVMETIEKRKFIQYQPLLQKHVQSDDEELRIRALKAIANTGVPFDGTLISGLLKSSSWTIRMMATKVVGMQRIESFKEQLIELLSDREYLVRAEAAKAILRFKDGVSILTSVTKEANDLFAKDMAIEWLEKESRGYSY
jgi:HEAT repeat protein